MGIIGVPLHKKRCRAAVDTRAQIYLDRLLYWQDHWRDWSGSWAAFLCR